jgi:voltage-gated sodium channel
MYFVSFVMLGTFVVINLFIAVVINNLDVAKAERLA